MSILNSASMGSLAALQRAQMPDRLAVLRYTETNTPDGVEQGWATVESDVPCRVSPLASSAAEGSGTNDTQMRALSDWTIWCPAGTDASIHDRVEIAAPDGRTFEVQRVGARSYETVRELLCALVE